MSTIIVKVSFSRVERNEIELKQVVKAWDLYQILKLSSYFFVTFYTREHYLRGHHKLGARDIYRI